MAIFKKMTMLTYAFSFKVFLYEHKEIPNFEMDDDTKPTPRGFEPLRAEPTGFQVQHLNHSVTVSVPEFTNIMGASTPFCVWSSNKEKPAKGPQSNFSAQPSDLEPDTLPLRHGANRHAFKHAKRYSKLLTFTIA